MWLAPNLITLLGTMGLLIGYVCSAYYLPEFEGAGNALCTVHSSGGWLHTIADFTPQLHCEPHRLDEVECWL